MIGLFRWISNRVVKLNKDCRIVMCGESGSGKSWMALSWAEYIISLTGGRIFLVFKAMDFLDLLEQKKVRKGDVVIWDEGGVEAMNRNWYSELNKAMMAVFETMRLKNFVTIMTVPGWDMIDSGIKKQLHLYVETKYIDEQTCQTRAYVMRVKYYPRTGETHTEYFRWHLGGQPRIVKNYWFQAPSQEMIDMYEPLKDQFTSELYTRLKEKITKLEENKSKDWNKPKDYAEEIEFAKTIVDKIKLSGKKKVTANRVKTVMGANNKPISIPGAKVVLEHLKMVKLV